MSKFSKIELEVYCLKEDAEALKDSLNLWQDHNLFHYIASSIMTGEPHEVMVDFLEEEIKDGQLND